MVYIRTMKIIKEEMSPKWYINVQWKTLKLANPYNNFSLKKFFDNFFSLQEVHEILLPEIKTKQERILYDWYANFKIEMIWVDTQHLNEINWEPLQHCCYPKPLLGVLEDLFLERLKFELRLWKDFLFLSWTELSMLYAMSYVLSLVPFFLLF